MSKEEINISAQEEAQIEVDKLLTSQQGDHDFVNNRQKKEFAGANANALIPAKLIPIDPAYLYREGDIFDSSGICTNIDRHERNLMTIDVCKTLEAYIGTTNIEEIDELSNLMKLIFAKLIAGNSPFIQGIPGTGKTWTVNNELRAILNHLFSECKVPIIDKDGNTTIVQVTCHILIINASASTVQDITGEQIIDFASGGKFSRYVVSEPFKRIITEANTIHVIFLDELNRAQPEVITACMKIIDGELNPSFVMPLNSVVLAAGNLGDEDNTNCIPFFEMDAAMVDRFGSPINFPPSIEKWLSANEHHPKMANALIDLVKAHQPIFQQCFFSDTMVRISSPRSLTAYFHEFTQLRKMLPITKLQDSIKERWNASTIPHIFSEEKNSKTGVINKNSLHIKEDRFAPLRSAFERFLQIMEVFATETAVKLSFQDPNIYIDQSEYKIKLTQLKNQDIQRIKNSLIVSMENMSRSNFSNVLVTYFSNTKYKNMSMSEKILDLIITYSKGVSKAIELKPEFGSIFVVTASELFVSMSSKNPSFKKQIFSSQVQDSKTLTLKFLIDQLSDKAYIEKNALSHIDVIFFTGLIIGLSSHIDKNATIRKDIDQNIIACARNIYDSI